MPIKSLIYRFQPAPLYVTLVLSICYFSVQLVFSHITHALTLLMASYHMLCNIFALTGCIITIKQSNQKLRPNHCGSENSNKEPGDNTIADKPANAINDDGSRKDFKVKSVSRSASREIKLRNTFGWARIDVLAMLVTCIVLASLSFSLLVEALQTLVHIDHQDTMHLPIPVMILGFVGLLLNGLTYLLIGGYTMHQGSFLQVTPSGAVILDRTMSNSADLALQPEERQLSAAKLAREQRSNDQVLKKQLEDEGVETVQPKMNRQGAVEMLRDISSTIFVIVCAFICYMAEDEQHTAKFIDPVLSIFSCVLLVALSYRHMKESCLILLQTIPDSIDIENVESTLVKRFPQIVGYHDLHIWQLAAHKYVATVHIQFQSPTLYAKSIDELRGYFREVGITELTIQPEFFDQKGISNPALSSATPSLECLVPCHASECAEKLCCKDSRLDLHEVVSNEPNGFGTYPSDPQHQQENEKEQQTKNKLIKKILPLFDKAKAAQRSKSTNDLVYTYKMQDVEKPSSQSSKRGEGEGKGEGKGDADGEGEGGENKRKHNLKKTASETFVPNSDAY